MTPHQKSQIDDAYSQGQDALRFVYPHLDHGEGISCKCAAYLNGRVVELDRIMDHLPEHIPAPRFCRATGYYVDQDGRAVDA